MFSLKKTILFLSTISFVSASAFADSLPSYTLKDRFRTVFSIGLQWDFGDAQAKLVLAARGTETKANNQVYGGKADIAIPLRFDAFSPTIRLLGVAGNRDVQSEFGFGWNFAMSQLIGGIGVQAPMTNLGVNFSGQGLSPFFGVNSINRAPAPGKIPVIISTITCC